MANTDRGGGVQLPSSPRFSVLICKWEYTFLSGFDGGLCLLVSEHLEFVQPWAHLAWGVGDFASTHSNITGGRDAPHPSTLAGLGTESCCPTEFPRIFLSYRELPCFH